MSPPISLAPGERQSGTGPSRATLASSYFRAFDSCAFRGNCLMRISSASLGSTCNNLFASGNPSTACGELRLPVKQPRLRSATTRLGSCPTGLPRPDRRLAKHESHAYHGRIHGAREQDEAPKGCRHDRCGGVRPIDDLFKVEDPLACCNIPLPLFPCHSLNDKGMGTRERRMWRRVDALRQNAVSPCRRPNVRQMPKLFLSGA